MIVFDLKCVPQGHVFEAWFGSSADYEDQRARDLVACPICGASKIEKATMAPRLGTKSNQSEAARDAAAVKKRMAELAAAQRKMLESSDYVGDRFADEARAIHLGEAEARAIHGKASRAQTEALREEGIDVAPLPFPVLEPGEQN